MLSSQQLPALCAIRLVQVLHLSYSLMVIYWPTPYFDPRGSPGTLQFSGKIGQIIGWHSNLWSWLPFSGNPGSVTGTCTKRKRKFSGAPQQIISIWASPVHRNSLPTVIATSFHEQSNRMIYKHFWFRNYEVKTRWRGLPRWFYVQWHHSEPRVNTGDVQNHCPFKT